MRGCNNARAVKSATVVIFEDPKCRVVSLLNEAHDDNNNLCIFYWTWWRHQMDTFSALLALCAGNSLVTSEFPAQRPVTQSFDVSFDLHLIKRLSKWSWGWWFVTPPCSWWCHCNDILCVELISYLDCYTVLTWWLLDCQWEFRHGLWMVVWLTNPNIG